MTWNPLHMRRLMVRLALVFAVGQLIAVLAVAFALPAMRSLSFAPAMILLVTIADLVILAVFAGWIIRGSVAGPMGRLSADVHRIADGDYHYRIGDVHRPDLKEIQKSVNRLADRLIANQGLLAENVKSLEDTNRELLAARDQVVRTARLASVGTLAAGIAHEVGNPLGAITAFVDVAIARARRDGADTDVLKSIRREAKRIDRIVRGLLDYAQSPSAGAIPTEGAGVLLRVRDLLESQGKLERVDVSWDLDGSQPHSVLEPHRLEQVMVNLLLNALHAVDDVDAPRVRVRLFGEEGELTRMPASRENDPPGINYMHRRRAEQEEAGIDSVATAERVTVIEVSDNGPGIAADDLDNVFDPFFTTKEPGEGTGLGLSICARLVEGMGGRIDAENDPEGGARFIVRLPSVDTSLIEESRQTAYLEKT